MQAAGFVNIDVKRCQMRVGKWLPRNPLPNPSNNPETANGQQEDPAAGMAKCCWTDAAIGLTELVTRRFIPDDYEREEFMDRVVADINNEDYQLYSTVYGPISDCVNG